MQYFQFHGNMPGYDNRKLRGGENIDPDKAAFSMAPHDDEAYERVNMDDTEIGGTGYGGSSLGGSNLGGSHLGGSNLDGDRYNSTNPYSADDFGDPDRYGTRPPPRNENMFDDNTEYSSGALGNPPAPMPYGARPERPETYDAPDTYGGAAQFPSADYERIHR